jgi:hypothetical protein
MDCYVNFALNYTKIHNNSFQYIIYNNTQIFFKNSQNYQNSEESQNHKEKISTNPSTELPTPSKGAGPIVNFPTPWMDFLLKIIA